MTLDAKYNRWRQDGRRSGKETYTDDGDLGESIGAHGSLVVEKRSFLRCKDIDEYKVDI
jgi:hypothetical protein